MDARDYVLLRMALDGAGFQEARRELQAQEGDAPPTAGSRPSTPAPGPREPSPAEILELHSIQVQAVAVKVRTEDASLRIDALQVQATRVSLHSGAPAQPPPGQDPLVIDLTGEGPATTGAAGAQPFDLQGLGTVRPTSFARGGTAFLVLDRNGNGTIDDGRELFGDQHGALDGYEELRTFDVNADGRIDAQDPVFDRLELMKGDGSRQALGTAGIQSLSLDARGSDATTSRGDPVLRQATAMTSEGSALGTYALALRQFDLLA